MMKHTGSLALGLGLFLGLPAFTFGGGLPDSLEGALEDTREALEVLGRLRQDLEQGQTVPGGTVEGLTESPAGTAQARDARLGSLREEVSSLQAQLDVRRLRAGAAPLTPAGNNDQGVTTGLPQTFVKAMGKGEVAGDQASKTPTGGATGGSTDAGQTGSADPTGEPATTTSGEADPPADAEREPAPSPEGKGYSAHPLRQAKACFRAGRYQQGLDILDAVPAFTEGDYWRAKCMDRLGRTDEAVALFEAVSLAEDAGPLADAAERDAEFAAWRRELEDKAGLRGDDQ